MSLESLLTSIFLIISMRSCLDISVFLPNQQFITHYSHSNEILRYSDISVNIYSLHVLPVLFRFPYLQGPLLGTPLILYPFNRPNPCPVITQRFDCNVSVPPRTPEDYRPPHQPLRHFRDNPINARNRRQFIQPIHKPTPTLD